MSEMGGGGAISGRRILAIDGGGIKGAVPAAFLSALEDATGERIVDQFDLIAGTSTGGIIALGLGLGIPAAEILKFYRERGPVVFGGEAGRTDVLRRCFRWAWRPKHDPALLEAELAQVFGDRLLGESETRLVIPAYHRDQQAVYVFKTAHEQRLESDHKERAVDVGLATAAAPAYFPAHMMPSGSHLLDGGIWANNPVGLAAVEAVGVLRWAPSDLRILSLGCTEETWIFGSDPGFGGMGLFGSNVVRLLFQGQTLGALGTAKILTGHPHSGHRLWRYSPQVPKGMFSLDNLNQIERLIGLGAAEARSALPEMRTHFFTRPRDPFTPLHGCQT